MQKTCYRCWVNECLMRGGGERKGEREKRPAVRLEQRGVLSREERSETCRCVSSWRLLTRNTNTCGFVLPRALPAKSRLPRFSCPSLRCSDRARPAGAVPSASRASSCAELSPARPLRLRQRGAGAGGRGRP